MAIDPKTGLDLNIKVENPTLKKEVNQEKPKVVTPPKGPSVSSYLNKIGITPSPRNVNLAGADDSRYNMNLAASEIQAGNLEKTRAENQPWSHEAANAMVRLGAEVVGGGIEGFGIIGELLKFNKLALDTENVLINLGRDLKDSANEEFKIYNKNPGGFMLGSSENFFENIISLGSSLSMLIPVTGTFGAIGGLGKLAKGISIGRKAINILGKAGKLNKYQQWVAGGLSQAALSRHIESNLEAYGTYQSLLAEGLSKEDAEKAALDVYSKNWIMMIQDIPQYLAFGKVFNPMTGKFVKNATKIGSKVNPKYSKALGLAGVSLSEAGEEAFQYVVSQEAEYGAKVQAGLIDYKSASERSSEYFSDANFWNSMLMGAAGGAIFQTVMPKLQGGQSKSQEEKIQKQYLAARGAIFKNLAEMTAQADQTNDEAAQIRIRRKANNLLIQNALINDRYDEHLEWLDTLENLTPEQQQQLEQEERIELSSTVTSKVVPKLREESEAIRNEFLKHVNKHGVNKASLIALNQVDLQNQKEYVQQAYDNYTKIKEDVLTDETGSNILDPISQEFFDLTLDENAYEVAKAIKVTNISNNPNFSEKQKEIEIDKVNKNYDTAKAGIDKKRKEIASRDQRTSEEKSKVTEVFKNLNNKKEETKERELVKFRARHLSQRDELKRLEREKAYLNSPKFEFDKITSENLNEINKADDLNNLRQLGDNLEKNGQLNTVVNEYRQKEKEVAEKLDSDLNRIAKKLIEKSKQNNTKVSYEIGSLKKEDRYIVDRYKKQFNSVVASLSGAKKPKEISKTNTKSTGTEVNRKLDISFVIPHDASSTELNNYVDWLNQPVSYEGYTAVITRSVNQKDQYEYRVTFKDKQGNPVIHNDKEVFTWLADSTKNSRLNAFKTSINNNLDSNNQVFVKVKKQEVPDIQNTNDNNKVYEVFGEDVEIIYTNEDGEFVPFGKKSKDEVGKVVRNRLGTKTRRPGLIYIITKDINGEEILIKLNTPLLGEVENAAEVIYEIYRVLLTKGVEYMNSNVPQELLDMLKFDLTHFRNNKGEIKYSELLEQLVYDSPNTKGTTSNLESQKEWVYFGNDGVNYYKEGNQIYVDDVLTPRSSSIKDNSTLSYVNKNGQDYVKIEETGEVVPAKLRKGHAYKLTADNINNEDMKAKFIDFIKKNKRFNVKTIKSNEYLATLISEKLLTTDKRKGSIFEPIVDFNSKGMLYVDPTQLSRKEQTVEKSKNTQSDIEVKKADIERRRQEDLNIKIPINNYIAGEMSSKKQLIKFRTYLTDVLGWSNMPIGFKNKNLTLDYLNQELKIPAELIQAGGGLTSLGIDIKDVINAKYDAELAALGQSNTQIQDNSLQSNPEGVNNSNFSVEEMLANRDPDALLSDASLEGQRIYAEQEATSNEVAAARKAYAEGTLEELSSVNNYENSKNKMSSETLESKSESMSENVINVESVSDEEYTKIIDEGIVSQSRLNSVAQKIKNNQKLSNRENVIFNTKTPEINKILQNLKAEETTTPKSKEDAKLKFKAKHQSKLKGLNKEASVNPQEGEMTMAELLAKRKALEEAKKNNNESEIKCND